MTVYEIVIELKDKGYLVSCLSNNQTKEYKIVELSGDHPNINSDIVYEGLNKYYADNVVEIHNRGLIERKGFINPVLK